MSCSNVLSLSAQTHSQSCHFSLFTDLHPQVLSTKLKEDQGPPWPWDRWNEENAHYLMGQYLLFPIRLEGYPVYKKAETVGKENFFIFRERGGQGLQCRWRFSHILGASDGRYPSSCWANINPSLGLPPKEWKHRNGTTILKVLIPGEPKFCQSVLIGANDKVAGKMSKCLGTYYLVEDVWSCGRPVYKGPKNFVLMVTGKHWGVKRKLESWGEVVLQAKEASMGPGGGAPWMLSTGKGIWNVDRDVTVTELD